MSDAKVIPFPTRDVGTDDLIDVVDEEEQVDGEEALAEYLGNFDVSMVTAVTETEGRWVWEPKGESPEHEPPVGMVAHRIATMCKWTYQHIQREESIPQPCCYSVLITTKRLPGPVRDQRSWLAPTEEEAPHQ